MVFIEKTIVSIFDFLVLKNIFFYEYWGRDFSSVLTLNFLEEVGLKVLLEHYQHGSSGLVPNTHPVDAHDEILVVLGFFELLEKARKFLGVDIAAGY